MSQGATIPEISQLMKKLAAVRLRRLVTENLIQKALGDLPEILASVKADEEELYTEIRRLSADAASLGQPIHPAVTLRHKAKQVINDPEKALTWAKDHMTAALKLNAARIPDLIDLALEVGLGEAVELDEAKMKQMIKNNAVPDDIGSTVYEIEIAVKKDLADFFSVEELVEEVNRNGGIPKQPLANNNKDNQPLKEDYNAWWE
jgi:hypothetical protein